MATASEDKDVVVPRNTADFQRMKIEKLMKNHVRLILNHVRLISFVNLINAIS